MPKNFKNFLKDDCNEQTQKPMRAGLPAPDGYLQNQLSKESGIRKRTFRMERRTGAADSGRARLFGAFCAACRTAKEEINMMEPEVCRRRDCEHCPFPDCRTDTITKEETAWLKKINRILTPPVRKKGTLCGI